MRYFRIAPSENKYSAHFEEDFGLGDFYKAIKSENIEERPTAIVQENRGNARNQTGMDFLWSPFGYLVSDRLRARICESMPSEIENFVQVPSNTAKVLWLYHFPVCECCKDSGVLVHEKPALPENDGRESSILPWEQGRKLILVRWFELSEALISGRDAFTISEGSWAFVSERFVNTLFINGIFGANFYEISRPSGDGWKLLNG